MQDGALPREGAERPAGQRLRIGFGLLVLPLVVFIVLIMLWPVGRFLYLAVDNSDFSANLSRTAAALQSWTLSDGTPGEPAFAALVADLAEARQKQQDGIVAQAMNQRLVGTRFLVIKTAADAAEGAWRAPYREAVLAAHPQWENPDLWNVIHQNGDRLTDYHLLASLDLERGPSGDIEAAPPDQALYVGILVRTIWISLVVTAICAVLSLPLAQAIVSAPPAVSRIMFALVLFPLWTSLLVRTVIWIVVLQRNGPVNASLLSLGIVDEPLSLIYTRFSLYIAMVQVLLPMMVLSVVAIMRRVPGNYMRAALSLGAPWLVAWLRVQLPLILPGIASGAAIVFVFSLGYYITPTLVGGPGDQMISSFIAFYTNQTLNWGMAAALSIQLLLILAAAAFLLWTARALWMRRPAT